MTATLHDISARTELSALAEVVRALYVAGGIAEGDCLLIGAAARDVLLRHVYDIDPGESRRMSISPSRCRIGRLSTPCANA